jgi:caffeoyl-CoA O-methyltransferase
MNFLPEDINEYAEQHTSPETDLLHQLNRKTWQSVLIPRMLSGHLQGRFLSMMSCLKQPEYILEIGTYTGYSALCLAEGLKSNGQLHTIDINDELESIQSEFINQSQYKNQIVRHFGDALEIIPKLSPVWDLVFIDADKENYLNYYKLVIDKLSSGALIIADNVLWSGKVTDAKTRNEDEETKAIHEFNEFIQNDSRVTNVLTPIRDGLMIIRKL